MALTVEDLVTITKMPSEEDLSLQTIAEFYEQHLCNRIFHYHVRYDKQRDIRLRFKTVDLPHLIGTHKMKTGSQHRGKRGFPELKSGELTLDKLRAADSGNFERVLYRILYFPFVYQLMHKAKVIVFQPNLVRSMIDAEFMFYDDYDGRCIHVGARKEQTGDIYTPVTFVERGKVYPGKQITVQSISVYPEGGPAAAESAAGKSI